MTTTFIKRDNKKSNTADFIEKAKKKHENIYDYSKSEYINAKTKVCIICNKCEKEFMMVPNHHLSRGDGCKICGRKRAAAKNTKPNDQFIEDAQKKHIDEFGKPLFTYQNVIYINSKTKVLITCKKHGDFEQIPSNHLYGFGCIKCRNDNGGNSQRLTKEEFIEKSQKKHIDEFGNPLYKYTNVEYKNSHTDVCISCNIHGDFKQRPNNHLNGQHCPNCAMTNYSTKQIQWLEYISKLYNLHIQHAMNDSEYTISTTNLKADGYCKETNTIYEFHGDFWHGNPKLYNSEHINPVNKKTFGELYQHTIARESQIKELGYNLIVLWEYDWNNVLKLIIRLQQKYRYLKTHK